MSTFFNLSKFRNLGSNHPPAIQQFYIAGARIHILTTTELVDRTVSLAYARPIIRLWRSQYIHCLFVLVVHSKIWTRLLLLLNHHCHWPIYILRSGFQAWEPTALAHSLFRLQFVETWYFYRTQLQLVRRFLHLLWTKWLRWSKCWLTVFSLNLMSSWLYCGLEAILGVEWGEKSGTPPPYATKFKTDTKKKLQPAYLIRQWAICPITPRCLGSGVSVGMSFFYFLVSFSLSVYAEFQDFNHPHFKSEIQSQNSQIELPFPWMQDQNSPRMKEWYQLQNSRTLRSLNEKKDLWKLVRAKIHSTLKTLPQEPLSVEKLGGGITV